jgi:hypothetical protein
MEIIMRIVNALVGIVLSIALIFLPVQAQDGCPPCYNNSLRPKLYRQTGLNGQPEEVITVKIDSSWDDSPGRTNSKIYNAVDTMIDQWNATDPTGPRMVFNSTTQNLPNSRVSVVFTKKELPRGVFGHSIYESNDSSWIPVYNSSRTVEIELDPNNISRDDVDIQGTVGHEIGHGVKGLGHPNPEMKDLPIPMPGTCKDSIMNPGEQGKSKRPPDANRVHPRDAAMAKQWRDRQKDCTARAGKEIFDSGGDGPAEEVTYYSIGESEDCIVRWKITADIGVNPDEGVLEFRGWIIVIDGQECFF